MQSHQTGKQSKEAVRTADTTSSSAPIELHSNVNSKQNISTRLWHNMNIKSPQQSTLEVASKLKKHFLEKKQIGHTHSYVFDK